MAERATNDDARDYNALDEAVPTLPAAWYYDPYHYQIDLNAIWQRNWVYVCRADALEEPGAYQTLTIGKQNIFVIRNRSGAVSGFFNTCRHRGSIILQGESGVSRAHTVSCPYHQWCYSSDDGRLVATSSFQDPSGFEKDALGLFPIGVKNWRGFIFVNLDHEANWDDSVFLSDGAQALTNVPLEDLVVGAKWSKTIACNWKTYWDNYNECLHCPQTHPALVELVPIYKRRLLDPTDRPDWREYADSADPKHRGGVIAGAETWSTDGSTQGHYMAGLSEDDIARRVTYADLPPSTYIAMHVDHGRIVRLLPRGPEVTELSIEWLFTRDAINDADYDRSRFTEFLITVQEEDSTVCELNQRGMHANPFKEGVLMPEEYSIKTMHDWIRAQRSAA